jgi:hypothetical protein
MTGRCEEYYTVCPIRFSRSSLSSDTSVTTLEFTDDGTNLGIQAVITQTSRRLVRSTSELNLSPSGGCSIGSLEILYGPSWRELNDTGFELSQEGSETHLTVTNDLAIPHEALTGQFLRLNISCPGYSGCLPFKIGGENNQTSVRAGSIRSSAKIPLNSVVLVLMVLVVSFVCSEALWINL